ETIKHSLSAMLCGVAKTSPAAAHSPLGMHHRKLLEGVHMKKFLLGAVAFAALVASPAIAADLRARPVYKAPPAPMTPYFTWTGCYIGGNVGGAYAYKSFSDTAGFYTGIPGQDLGSHGATGFIGGGQVGCDYQIGS